VRASSAFVRLFIRGLAWDADAQNRSLQEVLEAAAKARLTETSKGKVLIGTAANGASVNYALPPTDGLTAQDVAEVCSLLLDKIDAIVAANPGYGDEQIKAALLAAFPSVRTFTRDFSCGACR
jgi:hypothetical protein